MLEYVVDAQRMDSAGSMALVRQARLPLDTSLTGRADAFNSAKMLLASLAACIIKSAERAIPMLGFELRAMSVRLHAVRSDSPPRITAIDYLVTVDTDESDRRIALLHTNIRKYGTISNTLAGAVALDGSIMRSSRDA
ncbi:OsmC family protein [Devosia sp. SL43]|uniref:OsmC family protein n=1 Tax=Devosia sp. SL43 TaxID=2806348 RepID=UPI001F319EE5|nr:OsmC family protein [Devosia sp. SL43]UJW87844.1 OsmC family protein [Devosia sp. SL43]